MFCGIVVWIANAVLELSDRAFGNGVVITLSLGKQILFWNCRTVVKNESVVLEWSLGTKRIVGTASVVLILILSFGIRVMGMRVLVWHCHWERVCCPGIVVGNDTVVLKWSLGTTRIVGNASVIWNAINKSKTVVLNVLKRSRSKTRSKTVVGNKNVVLEMSLGTSVLLRTQYYSVIVKLSLRTGVFYHSNNYSSH